MIHVLQQDRVGCVIACLAMVLNTTYDEVRKDLGVPKNGGFTHYVWQEYLSMNGYAYQFYFRYNPITNTEHKDWPMMPWADVHFCSVDAGKGDGSHLVVMLKDGTVYDPISPNTKKLSDYFSVGYMAGLYKIERT